MNVDAVGQEPGRCCPRHGNLTLLTANLITTEQSNDDRTTRYKAIISLENHLLKKNKVENKLPAVTLRVQEIKFIIERTNGEQLNIQRTIMEQLNTWNS